MKKVLFVASVIGHIKAFHLPYLEMFKEQGFETHVAANGDMELPFIDILHNIPFERSPLNRRNISAYKQLKKIITDNEFDVIHCHTPVAAMLTRLVARKARKRGTKVIYTAHGFHFFKGAPKKNWMIFYPIEKLCARWTDVLLTINKEDYTIAKNKLHAKRVEYVPGVGINLDKFTASKLSDIERNEARKALGVSENDKMLLSVGELSNRKNHEVIIKAIAKLGNNSIRYFICGTGGLEEYLKKIIDDLQLTQQVKLLGRREDIATLCNCADLFVFPSKQEGLPVALMEAMACGLPIVCSDIRGNVDLIENEKGGYLCKTTDVDAFVENIRMIIDDKELCAKMSEINKNNIKTFELSSVAEEMRKIYFE